LRRGERGGKRANKKGLRSQEKGTGGSLNLVYTRTGGMIKGKMSRRDQQKERGVVQDGDSGERRRGGGGFWGTPEWFLRAIVRRSGRAPKKGVWEHDGGKRLRNVPGPSRTQIRGDERDGLGDTGYRKVRSRIRGKCRHGMEKRFCSAPEIT